jgi:autotransporter-associated beta strand protein
LGAYNLDNDDATSDLTITGPISGVGGSITWCTTNILALINANTFTGGVDMRFGTLLLGTNTSAGSGQIILDSGTALSASSGPGVSLTIGNNIDFTGSSAQLGNNDSDNLTLTGDIYGSGAVSYAGGSTGTLTLAPTSNSFGGTFTINSGTVYAANDNAFGSASSVSLTGSAALNVETGVSVTSPVSLSGPPNVLAGSGTIASPVTDNAHVVISPSASPGGGPGILTFSNGLTLANGGAIHFDIYNALGTAGTGFSSISATGGLALSFPSGSLTFNIVSTDSSGNSASAINFNPSNMYSWVFASSPTTITGTAFNPSQFNLISSGSFLNSTAGGTFGVTEVGNSLFLNFTPVPEPSTWALLGAGVLAVAAFEYRRRRQARA